ncbi:hypothetical protein [Pandoraea morbifera]|uniref:hypothetical protein n=1 Tax=Pandoraea morbifera TaxID=2508300 RepID=UPI0012418F1A|nr:hypothetical protein [Pandoraea morbifera]
MNRWRRLLVLWLLCVTMPFQAMAALRTHCAPGAPGTSALGGSTMASSALPGDAGATAMHPGMMAAAAEDTGRHAMHASRGMAHGMAQGMHDMAHHDAAASGPSDHKASSAGHTLHASCSACAACVVCTALPPSMVLRTPDAQPSTPIPFLRTSASSAVVGVPERPPKSLVA